MQKFKKFWWIWVLLCLVVIAFVVGGVWRWNNCGKPIELQSFTRTYSGMKWNFQDEEGDADKAVPVSISFDGVISDNPVFKGTVKIESSQEGLYYFEDCCVYPDEVGWNLLYICDGVPRERWGELDTPTSRNYGVLMIAEDWSEVTLCYLQKELGALNENADQKEIFAAPASTKEEALCIVRRLDEDTPFKDTWWD